MRLNANDYLRAMQFVHWQLRTPIPDSNMIDAAQAISPDPATANLADLAQTVSTCTACDLHRTRTHTVFGTGNPNAQLMIIGEAPGFYEDQQGKPFVGRAGMLLTSMLQAIGIERETVFIANVLKCRPPNNRDPIAEEVALCTNYLRQQIAMIKPTLILAVGKVAAHYLLQTKNKLENMRNQIHYFSEIPLIVTYHPAYLLRNPIDKKKTYVDLKFVAKALQTLP